MDTRIAFGVVLLAAQCSGCAPESTRELASSTLSPQATDTSSSSAQALNLTPAIYAQYHLWYTKELPLRGSQSTWNGWNQVTSGVTGGIDPTNFVTPWRRATVSKVGLPMTGPYTSDDNASLIAYQFTLAKAAGIDGMFGSVFDGDWIAIFQQHQAVAASVGIALAGELYNGVYKSDVVPWQQQGQAEWMRDFLNLRKSHSSYLRIGGKPAVWIANYPDANGAYPWGNVAELSDVLNSVQQQIGEAPYVIMTGLTTDGTGATFASIPQIGRIVSDPNISLFWSLYGHTAPNGVTPSAQQYEAQYQSLIAAHAPQAPGKYALHVYPGFDERGYFPREQPRGGPDTNPRQIIRRDGNGMYASNDGFLAAALQRAAANNLPVFLESWNDWGELTQIEPGLASSGLSIHRDPYSALKRIAASKGISSPSFSAPATSLLDPPLVTYCRHKQLPQYGGKRVILHGSFGLGQGATQSDGITFSVFYFDEDAPTYSVLPNGEGVWQGVWRTPLSIRKAYNGQLKSFSIDITPFLDKTVLAFGIDAGPSASYDWAYLAELKLSWYNVEVDLLRNSVLQTFWWNSPTKNGIPWGDGSDPTNGVARLEASPVLEDGLVHPNSAYLHPDWHANGFMHGSINFFGVAPDLARCGG